ncbi:hypothetical protein DL767_010862 [Monosporascus sp. MG133]|nr:hypothetical protein DL767_010862 [Monosporascus sp. MG133]
MESTSPSRLTGRALASAIAREAVTESARRGADSNDLHIHADSMRSSINLRYIRSPGPIEPFEWDLHDLWHTYYQASMNISAQHPAQDRLAFQIVQLQQQGALRRPGSTGGGEEVAITADGRLWDDLPFLAQDMMRFWVSGYPTMSASQRLNFAQFLAKLASAGLARDRLCDIGLYILRDTLETNRPLGSLGAQAEENTERKADEMCIAALLPCANAWLLNASRKLIELSDGNWNNCDPPVSEPGELLRGDLASHMPALGFNPQRWLYWLRRLQELTHEASAVGKDDLAAFAKRVADNMVLTLEETQSPMNQLLSQDGHNVGPITYFTAQNSGSSGLTLL